MNQAKVKCYKINLEEPKLRFKHPNWVIICCGQITIFIEKIVETRKFNRAEPVDCGISRKTAYTVHVKSSVGRLFHKLRVSVERGLGMPIFTANCTDDLSRLIESILPQNDVTRYCFQYLQHYSTLELEVLIKMLNYLTLLKLLP
jgi:hypothetical protein